LPVVPNLQHREPIQRIVRRWNEGRRLPLNSKISEVDYMVPRRLLAILLLSTIPAAGTSAASLEWRRYAIPTTGLSVDVPVTIFSEDGGSPEGTTGRVFFTKDRQANLTVTSMPNPENDSPAVFLEKQRPPADIQYRRVTSRFFAVSSIRDGRTWYNRCNRANGFMNCVLINYPAAWERQWDAIVTRISLSLAD
jgi:hypothetical protein